MTTLDFSPLMRSSVGFDRLTDLMEDMMRLGPANDSYPPYNIEKLDEEHYRISLAVAGFEPDQLDVTVQDQVLYITANSKDTGGEDNVQYLHRGIARRAFQRRFNLADHIRISGARLENGMLYVDLVRELPEEMKPRTIQIESGGGSAGRKAIEAKKAA